MQSADDYQFTWICKVCGTTNFVSKIFCIHCDVRKEPTNVDM